MGNNILSKRTRKVIDLKTKREIIALAESNLPHKIIADKFNLGRSTITKILLSKAKVLENDLGILSDSVKRIRGGKIGALENSLARWCISGSDSPNSKNTFHINIVNDKEQLIKVREEIDQNDVLEKAKELAKELGIVPFKASYSWLKKFKDRFKLNFDIDNSKIILGNKKYNNEYIIEGTSIETPILKSNFPNQICSVLPLSTNNYISYLNFDQFTHTGFYNNLNLNNFSIVHNNNNRQTSSIYFEDFNNQPFFNLFPNTSIYSGTIGSNKCNFDFF